MLQTLQKELVLRSSELHELPSLSTLYIGGGTPTIYAPDELGVLIAKVKQLGGVERFSELTVEANPDDLTREYLDGLLSYGVNRLSIGIQSFIDRDLNWMNRRHSASQAVKAVKEAQQAGFKNISIDFIYGIPAMSLEEWESNIDGALSLGIQHISAYHLGIESRTVFGRRLEKGLLNLADEASSADQFLLLKERMETAGFEHYEISNFAKNATYGEHNSSYWQLQPYVGIGPSAHSFDGKKRRWNVSNNKHYLDRIDTDEPFYEVEILDDQTGYNDYLLTSLRTKWGVSLSYVKQSFPSEFYLYLLNKANKHIKSSSLILVDDRIMLPSELFFISDSIIVDLFY